MYYVHIVLNIESHFLWHYMLFYKTLSNYKLDIYYSTSKIELGVIYVSPLFPNSRKYQFMCDE